MKRSFSSLSPREALHSAILIEQRNAQIYHRFAEMFAEFGDAESLEVSTAFWEMAVEERGHEAMLQQRYCEQYGEEGCSLTEEELLESIEAPKLESGDLFSIDYRGITGRERALQVALHAEVSAQNFYAKLADHTASG